jgi:hypothetical protein
MEALAINQGSRMRAITTGTQIVSHGTLGEGLR